MSSEQPTHDAKIEQIQVQDNKREDINQNEQRTDSNHEYIPDEQDQPQEPQELQTDDQVDDLQQPKPKKVKKENTSVPYDGLLTNIFSSPIRAISVFPGIRNFFGFTRWFLCNALHTGPMPHHVAFIMDGNRRYAKHNNMELENGHTAGAKTLVGILGTCFNLGIEEVSVYAFSIENFNRSQEEVDTLFKLLRDKLKILAENKKTEEGEDAFNHSIKVCLIGNRSMVPADILKDLEEIEEETKNNTDGRLNICAPYTSRDEILHSVKSITEKKQKNITLTEESLSENFYYGKESKPVDILVRTSGHLRLSDYLLWQCNENSSIYFVNVLWPDFNSWNLFPILFDWSFNRLLFIKNESNSPSVKRINLNDLPAPPPLATVTKR